MCIPSFSSFADELHGLLVKEAVSEGWVRNRIGRQLASHRTNTPTPLGTFVPEGAGEAASRVWKDYSRLDKLEPALARKFPKAERSVIGRLSTVGENMADDARSQLRAAGELHAAQAAREAAQGAPATARKTGLLGRVFGG